MANQLMNRTKITVVNNAVVAGVTDISAASVDMANYEGVVFLVKFGAITTGAATGIRAQQSSDDDVTDTFADIAGSAIVIADSDDNKVAALDIWRPAERYVRAVVDRATQNAVIDSIIAIQYGPRLHGVSQHDAATVVTPEIHASPAEGTA